MADRETSWKTIGFVALGVVGVGLLMTIAEFNKPVASPAESSLAQLASPTPDRRSDRDKLDYARKMIATGHGAEVLGDLESIKGDSPEFAEAQRLLPKAQQLTRIQQREETARAARDQAAGRVDYARELETRMLESYRDFYVRVKGPNNTILSVKYVLMGRPFVYNLMNDTTFTSKLKDLGFQRIIFTDGYDETWDLDLAKY